MSAMILLALVLGLPFVHAALVSACARPPGLRDVVHIGMSLIWGGAAILVLIEAAHGHGARIALAEPLPNVQLAFAIEPLGALMCGLIGALSIAHALHTVGYARAVQERAPARMMAFIALTAGMGMAASLSANLFTLFVCFQALALASFPLVAHGGDEAGRRASNIYLASLLVVSFGLFLPAMIWTYALVGTLEFRTGGMLTGHVDAFSASALLALFALGLGFCAIPPTHRWLIAARNASFPALALIQSIAVLPVGCVGLLKITAYVFGSSLHEAVWAGRALLLLVGVSVCVAGLVALSRQDIRERLTYSCLSQALAAVLGACLAIPQGAFAAALQVISLSSASAALLMAAGAVHAVTGRLNVADYPGLGRLMPWTMAGFALGAASMIGLPPFSGAWAKLWLITAAADAGWVSAAITAGVGAVLTFAHLGPLAAHALTGRAPPSETLKRPDGASILLVAPVALVAAGTLTLLFFADPIAFFLSPLWRTP